MSEQTKDEANEIWSRVPLWLKVSFITWGLLVLAEPFLGIANAICYQSFLSERGIGFFEAPGWDLFWEFHTGAVGGTLLALELAPWVTFALVWGGWSLWNRITD